MGDGANAMTSELFIPDGVDSDAALSRTTHLGVVAHADDLEFMALDEIARCRASDTEWFGGIVCTDGAGSVTSGPYVGISCDELIATRHREQCEAARTGHYAFVAQLGIPSANLTIPSASPLVEKLADLIARTRPHTILTHNPADKHATHLRVLVALLHALERVPDDIRPARLLGCEMWRSLDWVDDEQKLLLGSNEPPDFELELFRHFDSQIASGKCYDLAVQGRRRANATLAAPRAADAFAEATIALDMSVLIGQSPRAVIPFITAHIDSFRDQVTSALNPLV